MLARRAWNASQFEQDESQQNQQLANSLASQPYPQYQGALIQPLNAVQQQGEQQALNSATDYIPQFAQAQQQTQNALDPSVFDNQLSTADQALGNVNGSIGQAKGALGNVNNSIGASQQWLGTQLQLAQQAQSVVVEGHVA